MSTINNAVFLSEDEEDESFHGSDASSEIEEESSSGEQESGSKENKTSLKDVIRDRKIDKIYSDLLEESRKEFQERVCTVSSKHFMLEFQKRSFDSFKKNSNLSELKHYVELGVSLSEIELGETSVSSQGRGNWFPPWSPLENLHLIPEIHERESLTPPFPGLKGVPRTHRFRHLQVQAGEQGLKQRL
ncbi:Bucentaur or craniofacial development family protein [Cryptosporidium felis]|nr:Bucentaur or craniofacial development family protein [Cryptosporidium felis]